MIADLLSIRGAWGTLSLAVLVFGFAPGMVLAAIVRLIRDPDRRRELQAELYEVPRWERPFWVAQQFEVVIRLGLIPEVSWYWGRWFWHRAVIESGVDRHREYPGSFWIPSPEEKAALVPGDQVKLMWSVKRYEASEERMWVEITQRDGDQLRGRLSNSPAFVHLDHGDYVKFHIDDIIDYQFWNERDEEAAD
ncbi:DUF2314 domain-containing protein [Blastococcus sp. Marseille-P5729]|uniref:DUF2314 domain-containing protein n=1 Tax=Blastococcus sp. Marseille-P5729 TaxID=2086582 RepID=UPI0018FE916B|nr:DUF2314 domain-containing protein [Blastococcus sp. Marseille-P5729]